MKVSKSSVAPPESRPIIYVVDDEPLLLELATTLLEPLRDYRVKTFRNAESALAAYADADPPPALIITDYAMHRMNGLEFIVECRRLQPRQKIMLISGTVDESVYRDSPIKPDRFLAKPYQAREFLTIVETLLAA